jgi:hypothetical protein
VLEVKRPPRAPDGSAQITHSYIAVRRRDVDITTADLERIDVLDARELDGLQTSLRLARNELAALAAQSSTQGGHGCLRQRVSPLKRFVRPRRKP